jgi:multidrug efflux pump subunit AcrA (membrane-fusion protein)
VQYGSRLKAEEGDKVKRGQRLAEWDPYTRPIMTEVDGIVAFEDLVENQSMSEAIDEAWITMSAADETRARLAQDKASVAEAAAADAAKTAALQRFRDMGEAALARAGASAPDVAVRLNGSTFSRDKKGAYLEIAGRVTNTGDTPRTVTALMLALVDRLDLPLSSLAIPVEILLAPGEGADFSRKLPVMQARRSDQALKEMEPTETVMGRVPPDEIPWEVRVGAMGR